MQEEVMKDVLDTSARARRSDSRVLKTYATFDFKQGAPTAEDRVKAYTQLPTRYYSPDDECMKPKVKGFAKAQNFVMSFMRKSSKASISVVKPTNLRHAPSSPSLCASSWNDADCDQPEFNSEPLAKILPCEADAKISISGPIPSSPSSPRPTTRSTARRRGSVERRPGLVSFTVRVNECECVDDDEYVAMTSSKSFLKLASFVSPPSRGGSRDTPVTESQAEQIAVEGPLRTGLNSFRSSQDCSEADDETQRLMAKAFGSLHKVQSAAQADIDAKKEKLGVYRQKELFPFNAFDWGSKNSHKLAEVDGDSAARFRHRAAARQDVFLGGLTDQPSERASISHWRSRTPEPLCLQDLSLSPDPCKAPSPKLCGSSLRSPDPFKTNASSFDDSSDVSFEEFSPKASAPSYISARRSRSTITERADVEYVAGSPKSPMRMPDVMRCHSSMSSRTDLWSGAGKPGSASSSAQHEGLSPERCKSSLDLPSTGHVKPSPSSTTRRLSILKPKGLDCSLEELVGQGKQSPSPTAADQGYLPPVLKSEQEVTARRLFLRERVTTDTHQRKR